MSAPALDPVAAELAAAWKAFAVEANPPVSALAAFSSVVRPIIVAAREADKSRVVAPFVHGDPRVDRWETHPGGDHPPSREAPSGFEPLAAWSFAGCSSTSWIVWERPLRACEVKPATTEEGALAALLTAWDSWPSGSGRHGELLAAITNALRRAGLVFESGVALTETARAIIARAAERRQP